MFAHRVSIFNYKHTDTRGHRCYCRCRQRRQRSAASTTTVADKTHYSAAHAHVCWMDRWMDECMCVCVCVTLFTIVRRHSAHYMYSIHITRTYKPSFSVWRERNGIQAHCATHSHRRRICAENTHSLTHAHTDFHLFSRVFHSHNRVRTSSLTRTRVSRPVVVIVVVVFCDVRSCVARTRLGKF